MKSLVDGLPPDIAQQVHPDWRKNEREYWAAQNSLLPRYRGQWIAFADGAIIAAAHKLGAETIYSEDLAHEHQYGSTQVINPFRARK